MGRLVLVGSVVLGAMITRRLRAYPDDAPELASASPTNLRSMQRAPHGEDGQRHPLLMELSQTLQMRLPIMLVQGFDLFRPVKLDTRGTSPVLQTLKLLSIISIDLSQCRKLRFNGQGEIIRIEWSGWRRPKCASGLLRHGNLPHITPDHS